MRPLPSDELDLIVQAAEHDIRSFAGAHLVIAGGTGFIGSWLVDSALRARSSLAIPLRLSVLTRDPDDYARRRPDLAGLPDLSFVVGDIRSPLKSLGVADAVIHAATDASASLNQSRPAEMLDVIIAGMSNVLDLVDRSGAIPLLFTSSGAVYGRQPPDISHVTEGYFGAPDVMDRRSAYHEGKRLAELLATIAMADGPGRFVSARLFAFLGPRLPLDTHFAAGNFMRDVLAGRPVEIRGDGTPLRSYMHPIDLSIWLWAMLARGRAGRAYNVGSEEAVSIRTLAELINVIGGGVGVSVAAKAVPGTRPECYVPSTDRARSELGLSCTVDLQGAIERTLQWHRIHST